MGTNEDRNAAKFIDLDFLPTSTNVERGVRNLEFVLQQMHTALMVLTSYDANHKEQHTNINMIVSLEKG